MYIVRYGGNWDNPHIAFVTADEEVAKKLVETKKQQAFDDRQKNNAAWTNSRKARYNLSKLLLADPRTKETLGQEEYDYLVQEVEDSTKQWEYTERESNKTIDAFEYHDWYYEEAPEVHTLEGALAVKDNSFWT